MAIICACAPSVKALFGKRLKNVASRYGSRSTNSYGKGSYGSSSAAGEREQARQEAFTSPPTELKAATIRSKVDSARSQTPDQPRHIVHSMRTHETADDYHEEVPVTYSGNPGSSRIQSAAPCPAPNLFNTPFPPPPSRTTSNQRASFLMPPSPSISSDDEVNLVSGTERQSDYATEQMKHLASLQMSSDDLKRTSVRSISPSALSDAPLQPDPLMPSSRSGPTTRFIRSGQSRLRAQISL